MKKFILALVAMVTMTCTTASAMSYEQEIGRAHV